MSKLHLYQTDSGIREYDRAVWLQPPSEVRHVAVSNTGISGIYQIGHSADATAGVQETRSNLHATFGMIFFPDGWEGHEVHVADKPTYGKAGWQALAMGPGVDYRWITHATRARAIHFHAPASLLAQIGSQPSGCDHQNGFLKVNPQLRALATAYVHDLELGMAAQPLVLDSYAILLARYFYADPGCLPARCSGGLPPRVLKTVRDFLMSHLAEDVSLAELAAIADLSPHHFCRAFKQSTGLPPHAWLTARRIERAQELMAAHPKMGLTEVALCVGYQSQAAFGVAFRRVTGCTPGQWRRERAG